VAGQVLAPEMQREYLGFMNLDSWRRIRDALPAGV
jgi:hypothetical protein